MNNLTEILPYRRPLLIAGPCSAESRGQMLTTAAGLAPLDIDFFRAGIWKPRTRPGGFEGYGKKALKWLIDVRNVYGLKVGTEVGSASHAEAAINAGLDMVWIGARTSASPFAVQEIAEALAGTDMVVFVKNPVCADVELWIGAVERLYLRNVHKLGAIHRGFKSPDEKLYRNSPLWGIVEEFRREVPEIPVIFDPSHIAGKRNLIEPLVHESIARNYDGLIIESHYKPDSALTDAAQQLTPDALKAIIPAYALSLKI